MDLLNELKKKVFVMLELLVQKLENEKSADHNCYRTL